MIFGIFGIFICSEMMEFDLKWVHVARYELILKLDGAIWLSIIFQPLLTPQKPFGRPNNPKTISVSPPPVETYNLMAHCHIISWIIAFATMIACSEEQSISLYFT